MQSEKGNKMNINRSVFKYIEHELYSYPKTKKEIEEYREEVLEGAHFPEVNVRTGPGDITANKAVKLTSTMFIMRAERTVNAIESALTRLDDRHRELYIHKYHNGLPWQEVATEMCISDRTYFRIRREIVKVVGLELGLLDTE